MKTKKDNLVMGNFVMRKEEQKSVAKDKEKDWRGRSFGWI
jgi:hypothetical protein